MKHQLYKIINKVNDSNISNCCNEKLKTTDGFIWKHN
jgi:hypothetical protein